MLQKFLQASSIHGLSYLDLDQGAVTRLFWLATIVASATLAGNLIKGNYGNWKSQAPIVNNLELALTKVKKPT